jgi:hypothetical protein
MLCKKGNANLIPAMCMKRYLGKTETLAILLIGEGEEFLRKEGFSEDEIAEARKLLLAVGLKFGVCPQCKKPAWLQTATIVEKHRKQMFAKREYELCGSYLSPILVNARKRRWKIKDEGYEELLKLLSRVYHRNLKRKERIIRGGLLKLMNVFELVIFENDEIMWKKRRELYENVGRYPMHAPAFFQNLHPMAIVTYNLKALTQREKMKVIYRLFGKPKNKRDSSTKRGRKLGDGCFIIPIEALEETSQILKEHNVKFEITKL